MWSASPGGSNGHSSESDPEYKEGTGVELEFESWSVSMLDEG